MDNIPEKLKPLLSFSNNNSLDCIDINLSPEVTSLCEHFSLNNINKNEFVIWGELLSDNIVMSWRKNGIPLDVSPIAVIDSEASPVSVIAATPEDFLQLSVYGIREISFITESLKSRIDRPDSYKMMIDFYNNQYFSELRVNLQNKPGYSDYIIWLTENLIPIIDNPISLIENAISKYPDFHERMRQEGLPF